MSSSRCDLTVRVIEYHSRHKTVSRTDFCHPESVAIPYSIEFVVDKFLDGFEIDLDVNPDTHGEVPPIAMALDRVAIERVPWGEVYSLRGKVLMRDGITVHPKGNQGDAYDNLQDNGFVVLGVTYRPEKDCFDDIMEIEQYF